MIEMILIILIKIILVIWGLVFYIDLMNGFDILPWPRLKFFEKAFDPLIKLKETNPILSWILIAALLPFVLGWALHPIILWVFLFAPWPDGLLS